MSYEEEDTCHMRGRIHLEIRGREPERQRYQLVQGSVQGFSSVSSSGFIYLSI